MIEHMALLVTLALAGQTTAPATNAPTTQPDVATTRPAEVAPPEPARQVLHRFVEHTAHSDSFSDAARNAILSAWHQHEPDDDPDDFLMAGLVLGSKPLADAIDALDREIYANADRLLALLIEHDDPYLSLHANVLLARSYVEQDRLEEAATRLATLAGNERTLRQLSFLEPEVDFLLGYCRLANLRYDEALATLETFERQHPNAPESLRLPARQMLLELRNRRDDDLGEVSDLMTYVARRLARGDMTDRPQSRQQQAIDLLDKLIEQTEQKEQQAQAGGGGSGQDGGKMQGNPHPGSPADKSLLPSGAGRIGELRRSESARPGEAWGNMKPEQRERILQSLGEHFPSQYRQLIEQYYQQLAKEQ